MVDLFENGQSLLPGVTRCVKVAAGAVGVSEVGQVFGFIAASSEPTVEAKRLFIAGDGLIVMSSLMVNVAEAVPGMGLPDDVVEFLKQPQGLLAVGKSLLVIAEHRVAPADPG